MLCSIKRSQTTAALNRGVRRLFSKLNYALLYPSKSPIVPLQTFVTTLKEEDKSVIQKLGLKEVAAFYLNNEESKVIPEDIAHLISEAKEEAVVMMTEEQKQTTRKRQSNHLRHNPMKKEYLMGQGLAVTIDDDFQEFLSYGEKMSEATPFSAINSINEVQTIGSLCRLNITNQMLQNNKRTLMTLEGFEKIRLYRELTPNEQFELLEKSREDRLRDLKEKTDNVSKLKQHSQFSEFTVESLKRYTCLKQRSGEALERKARQRRDSRTRLRVEVQAHRVPSADERAVLERDAHREDSERDMGSARRTLSEDQLEVRQEDQLVRERPDRLALRTRCSHHSPLGEQKPGLEARSPAHLRNRQQPRKGFDPPQNHQELQR